MAALFFLGWGSPLFAADDPKPTGFVALGGFNKYVFRGYEYSSGSVVLQPSVGISYRGFSISFWGNIDTDENPTQSFVPDRPGQ